MGKAYSLAAVFKIIDKATAPLNKIENQGKKASGILKSSFIKTEQQLHALGGKLKTFSKYAVGLGFGAIGAGVGIATKQFIDFDSSLHAASAAFSDMNPKAADFADKLDFLGKAARNVAAITEFNAQQTANALSTLARAGIDSTNAIALLPNIADLATSAMVDIDSAVNMATGTLSIFGKLSDDPKILADNMKYISDVLAKTSDMASHSIEDVVTATAEGGDMFKNVNQSIENFNAALVALAKNDIKGSKAGMAMRNIMLRLSAPAASGEKALKKLGIRTKDSAGNLLNMVDIIKQFETSLKGVGTADAAEYLDAIFGKQNITAARTLISAGSDKLLEYTSVIDDSFGAAAQKAGVMRQSLKNQIAVLMSGLTELGFKFVDAFAKKGSDSIQKLTEAVTKFDPTPIIDCLKVIFDKVFSLVQVLWSMRDIIAKLVVAWAAYKAIVVTIIALSKVYGVVLGVLKAVIFGVTLVTKGQTAALALLEVGSKSAKIATIAFAAAQKIGAVATGAWTAAVNFLNAAFIASPIGWIVLAIGALIAAVVLCIKYWDEITAALARAWEWVKKLGGGILSNLLWPIEQLLKGLAMLPIIGEKIQPAVDKLESFRAGLNTLDKAEVSVNNVTKPIENMSHGGGGRSLDGDSSSLSVVSPAQQAAYYSRQDTYQHAEISVKAEPGTSARVSKPPASPNFNLAVSGGAGRDF